MNKQAVKPRAVVFFSGQGGACKGLEDAGWDVVRAVDIVPQPHYYRPGVFEQGDAVDPRTFWRLMSAHLPHLVWGSPPCQAYSRAWKINQREHPRLIKPFRELVQEWATLTHLAGGAYVIENVEEARPELIDPIMLCGASFPGLNTYRHRLFESNVPLTAPVHLAHVRPLVKMGRPLREGDQYHAVGNFSNVPYVRANMGVPWMTRDGIRECIPPVYAEHVGRQLIAALR